MTTYSEPFTCMLGERWMAPDANLIELKGNDWILNLAMEILFRALHHAPLTDASAETNIDVVWSIVMAGDMWRFSRGDMIAIIGDWFAGWAEKNLREQDMGRKTKTNSRHVVAQVALYPCWLFNYAPGFMAATKWLVYNSTHVKECNPTKHKEIHLPKRICRKHQLSDPSQGQPTHCWTEQLNAARGRLKGVMHDALWGPMEKVLRNSDCECWEKTTARFERALLALEVFPLERTFSQTSVVALLGRLKAFKHIPSHEPCSACAIPYEDVVEKAIQHVTRYFDGLCLRCMAASHPDTANLDLYWSQKRFATWHSGGCCRGYGSPHGNPSWYFSYMGTDDFTTAKERWFKLVDSRKER